MEHRLKIISAYRGMTQYIHAVRGEVNPEKKELWQKLVIEPYWDEWAAGQFNEERIRESMSHPAEDIDRLEEAVHMLENSGLEIKLQTAYERIVQLLPFEEEEKVICIYADTGIDTGLQGVLGNCVGDSILIQINPFINGWQNFVPWVLAHEYNHTVWGYNYYYLKGNRSQDLLTSIITEGEADSFAKAVCPESLPEWLMGLTDAHKKKQWEILKEYLGCEDTPDLHERFFFGADNDTPSFTGYQIGYDIVQRYLKEESDSGFKKLAETDAWDILKISRYDSTFS